jgi:hypothetical protein
MGRTIPSWRIVVDEELARLARFKQFLRAEDRAVFEDLPEMKCYEFCSQDLRISPMKKRKAEPFVMRCI